jgi:hypothetical protein
MQGRWEMKDDFYLDREKKRAKSPQFNFVDDEG